MCFNNAYHPSDLHVCSYCLITIQRLCHHMCTRSSTADGRACQIMGGGGGGGGALRQATPIENGYPPLMDSFVVTMDRQHSPAPTLVTLPHEPAPHAAGPALIPFLHEPSLQLIPCLSTHKETPCPSGQEAAHRAWHVTHASCCTSESSHTLSTLNPLAQEYHPFPILTTGRQADNHTLQTRYFTEAKV